MSITLTLLIVTVFLAIAFDFVNGFHDAANSIATIVSTRVLSPSYAVAWAALFNLLAMLIFAPKVANTISKIVKVEMNDINYVYVVLTGLLSATLWDLFTWRLGLPTSSSHALIGGIAGAGVAYAGWDALQYDLLLNTVLFIFLAPLLGLFLGLFMAFFMYWSCQNWRLSVVKGFFKKGQLFSAALYSLGHGANDAQKTMGIIVALFVAAGWFKPDIELSLNNPETAWIILVCQFALALGTAFGGWRIVKTMGMKIVKLKPIDGFCAETGGALTLFLANHYGIPVSTTQTITGSIIGVGTVSSHFSQIKWGVAANVLWAWVLTLPITAALAAVFFYLVRLGI